MAQPYDGATTLLSDLGDAVRQVYHEKFVSMIPRFGKKTNRLFKFSKRRLDGDGVNIQVMDRNLYGARTGTDINADFHTARAFSADSYKVTLSETPGSNHFRRVALSLQVSHLDLKRRMNSDASAVDFKEELVSQSMKNIAEHIALRRHLDSTAKIATINGTPARNDNRLFASCTAIDNPTTQGARFPVDGGSIAGLQPGMVLHSYTGTTQDYTLQVTDYNPRDLSVGVYGVNTATDPLNGSTAVNITGLADNDNLYLSGEKDANILSLGHWFSTPSTGDSFFGKDRTDPINRYLLPHVSGPSSNAQLSVTHIDNLAIEMGYIEEDPEGGYVALTTPELEQRYRNQIGADVVIQFPTDEGTKKLFANYGFEGSVYRHPTIGRIVLQSDPFAPTEKIRFLKIGDWESLCAPTTGGEFGWEWLPGDVNGWYRMASSTAGNGNTTTYRMDGMLLMCDICLRPRQQAQIVNVTHT
jgi:hypothetical protein